jgi:hypothetical protein
MSSKPIAWIGLACFVMLIAAHGGCQPSDEDGAPAKSAATQAPEKPQKLKVLSIDDPQQIAARIAQAWAAQTGGNQSRLPNQRTLRGRRTGSECDIAIYPVVGMGELLARIHTAFRFGPIERPRCRPPLVAAARSTTVVQR